MADANPKLWDEQALATARKEGAEHLAHLRDAGMLSVQRSVTARALPLTEAPTFPEGSETKILHLIRHGQGFHNLLGDIYRQNGIEFSSTGTDLSDNNPYRRPELVDPPLTSIGREQARALQPYTKDLNVELVVVSSMVRATQTAIGAFAHLIDADSQRTSVPFVAHEGAREPGGVHTCDKRSRLSDLKREFPMIDYSEVDSAGDEDPLWHPTEREATAAVCDRAYDFLLWLRARPEKEIAVAAHSCILFTLINAILGPETPGEGVATWMRTGEMRSLRVSFSEGPNLQPPGSHQ